MFTFGSIIAFLGNNVKWIAIGIAAVMFTMLLYKLYDTIKENGENRIIIQTLEQANKNQVKIITLLEKQSLLTDAVLAERDEKIKELEQESIERTQNLGPGASDQAAPSIKEYFKRLQTENRN